MPDFRIVDTAEQHPKLRSAGLAAAGLWSMAGAKAMKDLTDGWVPEHWVIGWPSGKRHAGTLVKVGLWVTEERQGVPGYRFHDWGRVQRSVTQIENERARSRQSKAASRRASRPDPDPRPPLVPPNVPAGQPRDTSREWHTDNGGTPNGSPNGVPPSVRRESRGSPYPQHPEGVAGGESSGKQRAGEAIDPRRDDDPQVQAEIERQPCGRRHDPAQPCGGCANRRRMQQDADAEAQAAADAERAERARIAEKCSCRRTGGWIEDQEGRPVVHCDHERDPQAQLAEALDHAS